jgi:[ribosomal protein S18]-alanine N-acetyltransferase
MIDPCGFSVRRAAPEDAPAILGCLAAAFAPYRERYTTAAYEDTILTPEALERRFAAMTVLVAAAEGAIVGTIAAAVAVGGAEGHVRGMAVLPSWQGRGVADALLAAAEADLRARGCDRVSLDTTRPLARAIRFYERHGYRTSGRVSDFFGMELIEYLKPLSRG